MRDCAALPAREEVLQLGVKSDKFRRAGRSAHDGRAGLKLLAWFMRLLGALGEVGKVDLEASHIFDVFFRGGRLIAF